MKYVQDGDKVILKEFDSFDIEQILECGQCFRFEKISEKQYVIIAKGKVLNILQKGDIVEFYPLTVKEFEDIWIDYFDLNNDYSKIKDKLSKDDEVLKKAIEFAPGIRILNQQPWECLISFIISQNNRIPMIKKVIKNISQKYGEQCENNYFFPTLEQLSKATDDELKECKTGFRSKYILDAIDKVENKSVNLDQFDSLTTEKAKETLISIKGVGTKVADCVLLFSLKRKEVFPTDVWIKRVMEHFYFDDEETSIKKIHEYAKEHFGEYAGYAQQYLFYYARELKIGVK